MKILHQRKNHWSSSRSPRKYMYLGRIFVWHTSEPVPRRLESLNPYSISRKRNYLNKHPTCWRQHSKMDRSIRLGWYSKWTAQNMVRKGLTKQLVTFYQKCLVTDSSSIFQKKRPENYRGITLLSISSILLDHITINLE